jgi:hypothetical protein
MPAWTYLQLARHLPFRWAEINNKRSFWEERGVRGWSRKAGIVRLAIGFGRAISRRPASRSSHRVARHTTSCVWHFKPPGKDCAMQQRGDQLNQTNTHAWATLRMHVYKFVRARRFSSWFWASYPNSLEEMTQRIHSSQYLGNRHFDWYCMIA